VKKKKKNVKNDFYLGTQLHSKLHPPSLPLTHHHHPFPSFTIPLTISVSGEISLFVVQNNFD